MDEIGPHPILEIAHALLQGHADGWGKSSKF